MEIKKFSNYLLGEIKKGLPGWDAHCIMAATDREMLSDSFIMQRNPRKSSVLVWLFPKEESVFTRLILRTQYNGVHSGQVSFPGGAMEAYDIDLWQTALREAYEEVGIPSDMVSKVSELSPVYIPPSNFWVQPFVAFSKAEHTPEIDTNEVQYTIDVNLLTLLEPETKITKMVPRRNSKVELPTPGYNIMGNFVWGATAMILSELEELLRRTRERLPQVHKWEIKKATRL